MAANLPQSGVSLVAQNAGQFISSMRGAEGALGSFQRGAGAMSQIVTGALRQVGAMVVNLASTAVKAVGSWLVKSIGVAGDFEQTLNVLGATSGATGAQLDMVAEKAKELGADLTLPATSAQDAAEVMLELSKAGLSVQESMDAAKGALQLSAAAQVDAATAAGIMAGALNAFELEASDAVRVADLLAAGANASSASMTDLAQGTQMAGFAFHAVGMPVEDLITSLAALTNVGLTGSDAGTALKNALMRLMKPTDKAAGLMQQLGFSAYDANGKMKPLPRLIADLNRSLSGMTDEQRNFALGTIFLSDGMKAMIPLLNLGADGFLELKDKVTVAGSAADVAGAQMKGWNGAIASTQSQMETLQLVVGTFLKNALTPLMFKVAEITAKVTEFADRFFKLIPAIMASKDPVRSFLSAIMLLAPSLNDLIFPITQIYDRLAPLIAAFTDGNISSQDLASALGLVRDVLGHIGETFQSVGSRIITALPGAIASVGALATGIITTIGEQLPGIIDGLNQWRMGFLNSITPKLPEIITSVGTVAANVITAIGQALPGIINALGRWAFAFLDWLLPALPGLLSAVLTAGLKVVEAVGGALPGIIEALAQWGAKFVQWVIDALPGLFTALLDLNARVLAWIVEKGPGILEKLAEWGGRFVVWVIQTIPKLIVALGELLAKLVTWVIGHREEIGNALTKWATAFVNWIGEKAIPGIVKALGDLWGQLKGWISETAGKISADDSVGSAIVSGIKKGVKDAWEGLKRWLMGLVTGLLDAARGAIHAGSPSRDWADRFGKPIPQGAAEGIDEGMPLVRSSIKRMLALASPAAANVPALIPPTPITVQAPQTNTRTYNMPVYSNQSPAVLSQSLALVEALST